MNTFANRKGLFRNTLIAAALAAGLGATGHSLASTGESAEPTPHSDSPASAISDTVINARVKADFLDDDQLKTAQIGVTTMNGVVTLTGKVGNVESKSKAIQLAKGVEGVKSVVGDDLNIPAATATVTPTAQSADTSGPTSSGG